MGGITGITQNDKALTRYLLTAPEVTHLVIDFWNGSVENKAREEHYQLTKPQKTCFRGCFFGKRCNNKSCH